MRLESERILRELRAKAAPSTRTAADWTTPLPHRGMSKEGKEKLGEPNGESERTGLESALTKWQQVAEEVKPRECHHAELNQKFKIYHEKHPNYLFNTFPSVSKDQQPDELLQPKTRLRL